MAEMRQLVQAEVRACLDLGKLPSVQKLPSDVTLTKVGVPGPSKKREEVRGSSVEVRRLDVKEKSPVKPSVGLPTSVAPPTSVGLSSSVGLPRMEMRMPGQDGGVISSTKHVDMVVSVTKTESPESR